MVKIKETLTWDGLANVGNHGPFTIGGLRWGSSNHYFEGKPDEIRIYNRPLSDDEIYRIYNDIFHEITLNQNWKNGTDSDSDSLPDAWEMQVFGDLDETDADTDNDGLTNAKELDLGTDPDDSDTDNDGLLDGVETNTGTWVSNSDRERTLKNLIQMVMGLAI